MAMYRIKNGRGRRIPHTHLFLIPTYGGDVLDHFFNALENYQESPQALAQLRTAEQMAEAAEILGRDQAGRYMLLTAQEKRRES